MTIHSDTPSTPSTPSTAVSTASADVRRAWLSLVLVTVTLGFVALNVGQYLLALILGIE
ncbi:MAG: hypothetical protein WCA30_09270 [Dermatophilaceae bacterium]